MPVDLSDWKILIVDDEPDNLGVLELVFRFHKATVFTAESAPQCVKYLESESLSLLLVDIQMPGMSGYDLLDIVRKDPRWRNLPVIAVSAHAMAGDSERALDAGFDGYVTKPVSALTLAETVKALVDSKRSAKEVQGKVNIKEGLKKAN
jgi:CheY-like chemotaxis protein